MTETSDDLARLQLLTVGGARVLVMSFEPGIESEEFDRLNAVMTNLLGGGRGQPWVLDLTEVRYAGSSLLGMLLNARQQVHAGGGELVVCGLSAKLRSIFQTCSLEALFEIRRTRDDALRLLLRH